jgi:hypothetical protein
MIISKKEVKAVPVYDEQGLKIITKKYLKELCEELDLYTTPSLNEKIYLHYKGFSRIDNLDEFINLRALYLDHNCIRRIENLTQLTQLRCLYLQSNLITKIENLDCLPNLMTLNLSHNQITTIENLGGLGRLQTLDLSYNYLLDGESLGGLVECQSLTSVDLSNNDTKYSDCILPVFMAMKHLSCLYLRENPVKREFSNYRKLMITSIPTLLYLDERPVNENERRTAEAWQRGGREAEEEEKVKIQQEKRERDQQNFLENKEREERARLRKKLELERIEREAKEKREELLQKKKTVLETQPEGWEGKLRYIDMELEHVNKYLDIDENNEDEEVIKNYAGISKYKCMMRTRDENGEMKYVGASTEEVDEYLEHQRQKRQEEEDQKTREQIKEIVDEEKERVRITQEGDPNALKERNADNVQARVDDGKQGFSWTSELEEKLEDLIEDFCFDFNKVAEAMNNLVKGGNNKNQQEKAGKDLLTVDDLRRKWTEIEVNRYREGEGIVLDERNKLDELE